MHVQWLMIKGIFSVTNKPLVLMVRPHTGLYVVCIQRFHLTFSCIFTAQVPDDEQFVPDFQSDSCEYPLALFTSCFVHLFESRPPAARSVCLYPIKGKTPFSVLSLSLRTASSPSPIFEFHQLIGTGNHMNPASNHISHFPALASWQLRASMFLFFGFA